MSSSPKQHTATSGQQQQQQQDASLSFKTSSSSAEPSDFPLPRDRMLVDPDEQFNARLAPPPSRGGVGKGILDLDGFFLEMVRLSRAEVKFPEWFQVPLMRNAWSNCSQLTIRAGFILLFFNELLARNWTFLASFCGLLVFSRRVGAPDYASALGAILVSAIFQPLISDCAGFEIILPASLIALPFIVSFERIIEGELELREGRPNEPRKKDDPWDIWRYLPVTRESTMTELRNFVKASGMDVKTGGKGRTKQMVYKDILQSYNAQVAAARAENEKAMEADRRAKVERRQFELQRLRQDFDEPPPVTTTTDTTTIDTDTIHEQEQTTNAVYDPSYRDWDKRFVQSAPKTQAKKSSSSSKKGPSKDAPPPSLLQQDQQTTVLTPNDAPVVDLRSSTDKGSEGTHMG